MRSALRYVDAASQHTSGRHRRIGPLRRHLRRRPARPPSCSRACESLAKNGVLVLTSITGGEHMLQIPADRINLDFVLGNKVMVGSVNASRENFETGVRDMSQAEAD